MIDHLSITTTDLDRAQAFCDAVMGALGTGGSDDGSPGIREIYGPDYCTAFVRDPDGNRLEVLTRRPEEQQ